jgi:Protein of unknown function with HXXEE motif
MKKSGVRSRESGVRGKNGVEVEDEAGVRVKDSSSASDSGLRTPDSRLSLWLFPATYVLHVAEEWLGGFPAWFSRVVGRGLSDETFLSLNLWALAGMTLGVLLAARLRRMRWLPVGFGTAVLMNGTAHLAATALTRSYSPGVVTGALLWLPLGLLTLARARRELPRRHLVAGVVAGLLMHTAVTLFAFFAG